MQYQLIEIKNKDQWEQAVAQFSEANFLHSWNWGEFHQNLSKKVIRVAFVKNSVIRALVQLVREPAKRGAYFAVAGGPLADWEDIELMKEVFDQLKLLALQHQTVFIRLRPQEPENETMHALMESVSAVLSPMHLTADLTSQLKLNQEDEEILMQMRKNTRYAIKKASKLKIETEVLTAIPAIKIFYHWQQHLAKKHHFIPFSEEFLSKQFAAFVKDEQAVLVQASIAGKLLAMAFIIFYNGEAVYHYGISTPDNDKFPGSYACQWAAIQEAKKRNCRRYNFWGVAPENAVNHRFAGVSLFKRGFGGQEIKYLPAYDLPISWKYWITYGFELIRKKMRRL